MITSSFYSLTARPFATAAPEWLPHCRLHAERDRRCRNTTTRHAVRADAVT